MNNISVYQKLAWVYSALFVAVAAIGYVPAFNDASGNLFGLFSLQLHDDLLHLGSGIWTALAAWKSERASIMYFKIFGVMYGLDGILGFFTGLGYLDLGIILKDLPHLDFMTRLLTNLPHMFIGGFAAIVGFFGPKPRQ